MNPLPLLWSDAAPEEIPLQPPRVLNVRAYSAGSRAVYIGREMPASGTRPALAGSQWANTIKLDSDTPEARQDAIRRFLVDLLTEDRPHRCELGTRAGMDLLCWCAPKLCHGDGLAALVGLTRFYGARCPHCGAIVASWLNWHEGLQVLTEAWVCQSRTCGRRGDARRPIPQLLQTQPTLL